jgi:hypothetical protein
MGSGRFGKIDPKGEKAKKSREIMSKKQENPLFWRILF